ncbi:hypothetical protein GQ457_06G006730 [Hibiscus cannabinus]
MGGTLSFLNGIANLENVVFATAWSLWLNTNELLFHGKGLNVAQLSDIVLPRVGWWARAKWPHSPMSVEDFLRNPDYWCRPLSEKDARVRRFGTESEMELLLVNREMNMHADRLAKAGIEGE